MRFLRDIVKCVVYGVLGALLRRRRRELPARPASSFRRVLLCEISLLGDAVSFTAALGPARGLWPEARLDALVRAEFAALVLGSGRLDGVLRLRGMDALSVVKAALAARRRGYDLALAMSPGLRNACAAALASRGASAGYLVDGAFPPHFLNRQEVEAAGVALSTSFVSDWRTHIAERGLGVLRALGARTGGAAPALAPGADAERRAAEFLDGRGLLRSRFVVFHPCAGERSRRWPAERFAELARRLKDELGLAAVWVGAGRDAGTIASAAGPGDARFVGRPLEELAALVGRAALFVGNDSGPVHLAGALGVPLVGIFGPGDPARLLPRRPDAAAIRGANADVCAVAVDEVLAAARGVLPKGRLR